MSSSGYSVSGMSQDLVPLLSQAPLPLPSGPAQPGWGWGRASKLGPEASAWSGLALASKRHWALKDLLPLTGLSPLDSEAPGSQVLLTTKLRANPEVTRGEPLSVIGQIALDGCSRKYK